MVRPSYTDTLIANNLALQAMNKQLKEISQTQRNTTQTLKKANDEGEKAVELAKTRSEASTKLVNMLEKENKQFNLLQLNVFETFQNFSKFQEITGQGKFVSILEYIDLILTGTSQKMKVFGIEVATARKVMYGFLPPGMFRLVNQLSTSIRTATGFIRAFKGQGEDTNNMLTTMGKVFRKLPNPAAAFKELGKGRRKRNLAALEEAKNRQAAADMLPMGFDLGLGKEIAGREAFERRARTPFERLRDKTGGVSGIVSGVNTRIQKVRAFLELQYYRAQRKVFRIRLKYYTFAGNFAQMSLREKGKTIVDTFIKVIKTPLLQALITGMFYLTMIVLVVALITKVVWPALKGAFETFKNFSGIIISGFMSIFEGIREVFTSLIEGDLLGVMNGLLEIAFGIVKVIFGLLVAVIAAQISFVINFLGVILSKTLEFGKNLIASPIDTVKENIGKIALVGLAVLGFFFGLPAMLVGIALFALFAVGRFIVNKIKDIVPGFANGGVSSGGLAVVGEKGPELVNLPKGSRVHSNKDSKKMVSSGGNTINITINARDTSDAELRRIADKIGNMVNNRINRRTSSGSMG